jgi:hypothetical protein
MICLVGNVETVAILLRRILLRIHARHVRKNVNFWITLVTPLTARRKGWTQELEKKGSKFKPNGQTKMALWDFRDRNHLKSEEN